MAKAEVSRIKHISFNNPSRLFNEELDPNIFQFDTILNPSEIPKSSNDDSIGIVKDTSFDFLKKGSAKQNQFFLEKTAKENKEKGLKNVTGNTINSLFNTDKQNVIGAMRVLQKSVTFLILGMLSFGALVFLASNLFFLSANPFICILLGIISIVVYIALTNLFFIIVADRSYIWLMIIGQVILLAAITIIAGGNLNWIIAGVAGLISLLYYLSYAELEKAQLGSRLFNLSSIVSESIRLLGTLAVLILCFGVMTQITSRGTVNGQFQGAENFVNTVFLSKNNIVDPYLIGTLTGGNNSKAFGFNSLFMNKTLYFKGGQLYTPDAEKATLRDFLTVNYKPGEILLSEKEKSELESQCSREHTPSCDPKITLLKDTKLNEYKNEAYNNLSNNTLDTYVDVNIYRTITKNFYFNQIHSWSNDKSEGTSRLSVPIISNFNSKYILPAIFVFVIFISLMLLKPIYSFLAYLLTWIFWQMLKLMGFARIEIETVESEVVSI